MVAKKQKSELQRMSTEPREVSIDNDRTQHVRLVFASHRLEASFGPTAPSRKAGWHRQVNRPLDLPIPTCLDQRRYNIAAHRNVRFDAANGLVGVRAKIPLGKGAWSDLVYEAVNVDLGIGD